MENTIAHELNHTIYMYRHYDDFGSYTLLDNILLEGLAENFRQTYFDPETTPWAGALQKDEAFKVLKNSINVLDSGDEEIKNEFLFGGKDYKKWTGYSAGYWLVKEFIKENQNLSWNDLMKVGQEKFLEVL